MLNRPSATPSTPIELACACGHLTIAESLVPGEPVAPPRQGGGASELARSRAPPPPPDRRYPMTVSRTRVIANHSWKIWSSCDHEPKRETPNRTYLRRAGWRLAGGCTRPCRACLGAVPIAVRPGLGPTPESTSGTGDVLPRPFPSSSSTRGSGRDSGTFLPVPLLLHRRTSTMLVDYEIELHYGLPVACVRCSSPTCRCEPGTAAACFYRSGEPQLGPESWPAT